MPSYTPYYNLAYFDFGDRLNTPTNVQAEIDRFFMIDKQIYGLYSVFGNGVVSGWEVFSNGYTAERGISIGVSIGVGIISAICGETTIPEYVDFVPPNSVVKVYATLIGSSARTRAVRFVATLGTLPSASAVRIASITTGTTGIQSIDNTDRDVVTFEQSILDAIDSHRHRGTPSKIDLAQETKGQLSGAKIEGVPSSKIGEGRLGPALMPLMDHQSLKGIGSLTHAQLDAIVASLQGDNQDILGRVIAVNDLQRNIFLKYRYPNHDQYFFNELTVIPGVSPVSVIDLENSSAVIDNISQCVRGSTFASQEAYFFTKNFELPSKVTKIILVSNHRVVDDGSIVFGINTNNSLNFDDYQQITEGEIVNVDAENDYLRIGVKLVSPSTLTSRNPYLAAFEDFIDFAFVNETGLNLAFHFRVRFYTDAGLTSLYKTIYSGDDQEGWIVNDSESIPSTGYIVLNGVEVNVTLYPTLSDFVEGVTYYLVVDAWDGSSWVSRAEGYTFLSHGTSSCFGNTKIPILNNFCLVFATESGERAKLNLSA